MSKVFYDSLISLSQIEREINQKSLTVSEKEELWKLIDEIIHHRVLGCVLDSLPAHHHHDFLNRFHHEPHNEAILEFLSEKTGKNIEKLIQDEITALTVELLEEFRGTKPRKRFLTPKKIGKQNPQKKSARQK